MAQAQHFLKPSLTERIFNRLFAVAIGFGMGLGHNYVVEVKGRKSEGFFPRRSTCSRSRDSAIWSAPRGETNWVRNARAAGRDRAGARDAEARCSYRGARAVGDRPAPAELLKAYLDRFALTVQRYFPLPRESPVSELRADRRALPGVRTHASRRDVRACLISPRAHGRGPIGAGSRSR